MERKLLCEPPDSTHPYIAEVLAFFCAARAKFLAEKLPYKRWATSIVIPLLYGQHIPPTLAAARNSCNAQANSGRFRVDFALITKRGGYNSVRYRHPDAQDRAHRWLGTRVTHSPRLHRPNNIPSDKWHK
jgi:hypothetical protein